MRQDSGYTRKGFPPAFPGATWRIAKWRNAIMKKDYKVVKLENKYSGDKGGANTTSGLKINWFSNSPWSS